MTHFPIAPFIATLFLRRLQRLVVTHRHGDVFTEKWSCEIRQKWLCRIVSEVADFRPIVNSIGHENIPQNGYMKLLFVYIR